MKTRFMLVLLALTAWSLTDANHSVADENSSKSTAHDVELKRSVRELQRKLDKHIDIERQINTTLRVILEFLADRQDTPLRIDAEAFTKVQRQPPDRQLIRIPRLAGMTTDTVLRMALESVEAVYEIRENHVAIVPTITPDKMSRSFPPVTDRYKRRVHETRDRFKNKQLNIERLIQAPVKDIVEFLGDRSDFQFYFDEQAFRAERKASVQDVRVTLYVSTGKSVETILCETLEQAHSTIAIGPGYVRIVPGK